MSALPRPQLAYLVCATPRSGSTLLCEGLKATGVAGRPEEYFEALRHSGVPRRPHEYLDGLDDPEALVAAGRAGEQAGDAAPEYSDLRGVERYQDHLRRALERGTTANGVFGAKLMWGYLGDFLALLSGVPGVPDSDDPRALLAAAFGEPRFVWVRRADRVRQAVSLWRAMQTGSWREGPDAPAGADGPPQREPEYSFAALDHLARRLAEHDAAWERFFAAGDDEPHVVSYEQMAPAPVDAVAGVLRFLGIERSASGPAPERGMRRQSDERSDEWVAAYERDRAARDAAAAAEAAQAPAKIAERAT